MPRSLRQTEYGLQYIAEVLDARPLSPSCHHIDVERHPDFDYEPVQFTYLCLRTEAEEEPWEDYRPMSLASSPTEDPLSYGARLSDSAWKRAFEALEPGDEVMVEGPRGHFILEEDRPAVLVAGGIGITPLRGMARYAADAGLEIPVRLVYSNRDEAEIAYREELETLADEEPTFELVHTLTRVDDDAEWDGRRGRIDADLLAEVSADLDEPAFYLCGTPGMVEDMRGLLRGLGVPSERVRYEEFWGY